MPKPFAEDDKSPVGARHRQSHARSESARITTIGPTEREWCLLAAAVSGAVLLGLTAFYLRHSREQTESSRAKVSEVRVEDYVAATYDLQVVSSAEAAGRSVLFVALRGKDATAPRSRTAIQRAVSAMPGVDSASVRFSAVPPAASFAWDPKRLGAGEILRTVNAKLAGDGLALVAVRVIPPAKD